MKRITPGVRGNGPQSPRAKPPVFPFTRIVGQEEMKLALLLNVIDPSIGGVLIMGHRGTGKSTAVRALADLLPKIERVRDCLYGCDPVDGMNLCGECRERISSGEPLPRERANVPVVDLPLGATEDRLCGTINIERALKEGIKTFDPGLIARANRGFLYIDEVNLLEDHLIDILLDVAATGRNVVEREGISIEHPARFRLVGSGNPEEGELRPQLLDRFGLHVEVRTGLDLDERVRIVEQRDGFDRSPDQFRAQAEKEQGNLRRRLVRARNKIDHIELSRETLKGIAGLCHQLKIEGHRGELTIARAARALAAFDGRKAVTATDVRRVATMALRHRLRRDPLEETGSTSRIEQQIDSVFASSADLKQGKGPRDADRDDEPSTTPGRSGGNGAGGGRRSKGNDGSGEIDEPVRDAPASLDAFLPGDALVEAERGERALTSKREAGTRRGGRRPRSREGRHGRYVRSVSMKTSEARVAFEATLRAAAVAGSVTYREEELQDPTQGIIRLESLRYKQFKQKAGTLFIFAIDTSGSMALNRIAQAKGAMVRLLQQSYIQRDRVAVVSFRGSTADLVLRPSGSVLRAKRVLDGLRMGGTTPLAAGLIMALEVARQARRQSVEPVVLLVFTDGRANVPLNAERVQKSGSRSEIDGQLELIGRGLRRASVTPIVVDTQNRFTSGGEAQRVAELVGGRYVYLSSVSSRQNRLRYEASDVV